MQNKSVQAFEDLKELFQEKHLFNITVRFGETMKGKYLSRAMSRQIEAPSMKDACAKALSLFSDKTGARICGITIPNTIKTGSKRLPNPFLNFKKQKRQK